MDTAAASIRQGNTALGIEFGSTRIKAVLIGPDHTPIAQGSYTWENSLENGVWTYALDDVHRGLQSAYRSLVEDVKKTYGIVPERVGCIGISAMMHGYLAFDRNDRLLTPFRTWRNTMTGPAAEELSERFGFNIPQRWSIAHLYQAILNGEAHVSEVAFFTTLAGYVHWKLTGERVLGIGDASGMFPIDSQTGAYDAAMMTAFDDLIAPKGYPWALREILPAVRIAGQAAGALTKEGAALLDPSGTLQAGIPFCPPEGDAGTGMTATNSVAPRTGNVSAGTSIFAMVVLEKPLGAVYPEIDLVTTPTGDPVAMVHCNNCSSDLNAWVNLLYSAVKQYVPDLDYFPFMNRLFALALDGQPDGGGVTPINYYSGEGVTHFDAGRPLLVRQPDSELTLPTFMRVTIYSALATLKIGLDILGKEQVALDRLTGHGGLFKGQDATQRFLAAAAHAPVTCMSTAGEGGPYGMALLAAYCLAKTNGFGGSLAAYLQQEVFADAQSTTVSPTPADVQGFERFMESYLAALQVEKAAVKEF